MMITETRPNPNSISNVDLKACLFITFFTLIHLLLQVVELFMLANTLKLSPDQIWELIFHESNHAGLKLTIAIIRNTLWLDVFKSTHLQM